MRVYLCMCVCNGIGQGTQKSVYWGVNEAQLNIEGTPPPPVSASVCVCVSACAVRESHINIFARVYITNISVYVYKS